ncbi:hypothetical protein HLB23_29425 [Nocardia uniformis]|uniref:Uncharacterized protein n=1 Tax=Nocardia uniformis TaxID=53432 RepID=A0A849CES8_9NOCA|nr:hypothetical protein [Nocardia uniformis]NNH73929.1 hypothetical protein [Nocardia uniformis]
MNFLNVDVEVRDSAGLTDLREALEAVAENLSPLYCGAVGDGSWLLSFEVSVDPADDPDAVAAACCAVLERLPAEARARWDAVEDRVFDFGYDAVAESRTAQPMLSVSTLGRLADLGARLAVSVYAHDIVSRETGSPASLPIPAEPPVPSQ